MFAGFNRTACTTTVMLYCCLPLLATLEEGEFRDFDQDQQVLSVSAISLLSAVQKIALKYEAFHH